MSRHGYSDDYDDDSGQFGRWRGQVASATRGKRGQAFFRDLITALEAMPEKRLIEGDLVKDGEFCAMGAVGAARGINLETIDPEDYEGIAEKFGIAHQIVQEVEWENDENGGPTPEDRWKHMHKWATSQLAKADKERT